MTNDNGTTRTIPALLRSNEPTVIRQVIFPLRCFDHLKDTQRMYEALHGVSLSNNEVIALMLDQHAKSYPTKGGYHAQ